MGSPDRHGLDHDYATSMVGARSDVTVGLWIFLSRVCGERSRFSRPYGSFSLKPEITFITNKKKPNSTIAQSSRRLPVEGKPRNIYSSCFCWMAADRVRRQKSRAAATDIKTANAR